MKLDLSLKEWLAIKMALRGRHDEMTAAAKEALAACTNAISGERLKRAFENEAADARALEEKIGRHEDGEHDGCRACWGESAANLGPLERCHG